MSTRITIKTNGGYVLPTDNEEIFTHLVGLPLGSKNVSVRKDQLPTVKRIAALHNCQILHQVDIEPRMLLWRVSDGRKFVTGDMTHWIMIPEPFEPPMSETRFTFDQLNDGVSFTSNPEHIGINK